MRYLTEYSFDFWPNLEPCLKYATTHFCLFDDLLLTFLNPFSQFQIKILFYKNKKKYNNVDLSKPSSSVSN